MDGGGEGTFFKLRFGMYEQDLAKRYETATVLYVEMTICTEWLHKPHSYYVSLPKEEKNKLFFFYRMKMDREDYFTRKSNLKTKEQEQLVKMNKTTKQYMGARG